MAKDTTSTELGEIGTLAPLNGSIVSIEHTPHEAQILDGQVPHIRHAVSVTEGSGLEVTKIDQHDDLPQPYRVKGTRTVSELGSFLAELERRPLDDSGTLWGNADRGVLTAVYNDHDGPMAGWRDDQLTLELKPDADWVAWHKISGQGYRQEQFGDVIEELLHTVVAPDQAELLEIIDSIRASSKGQFESSITRANGSQSVVYNTEVTAKAGRTGQLEVPQIITLRLRPWEGHVDTYDVDAYFRLRIEGGGLVLTVKLKPTRQILRKAWDDITNEVVDTIGKPVYAQP